METGFLNPIHDEEHFSSSFYNQGNGLDDPEHMLFGEMIVPEIIDYDNLWPSSDMEAPSQEDDQGTNKEQFQKLLHEWQHQLNYMQEPAAIKQVVPLGAKISKEVSDMFPSSTSSAPTPSVDPSIDELFPLETNKEIPATEPSEENREDISVSREAVIYTKQEPVESNESSQMDSYPIPEETVVQIKSEKNIADIIKFPLEKSTSQLKLEREEQTVDVETVGGEDIPLLMAGDLKSLLEQFEATEKVNAVQLPPSPPRPSNQTIRDALPAEVINRIKATRENHKKMISVIPAMPNKRPGRAATRMQDAGAALSRNKLLKLVTGGSSGESVQLDHDYCTSGDTTSNSSRSYYVSDSSEYPSQSSTPDASYARIPDYRIRDQVRACDTSSRKDSGLESGENSDEEIHSLSEVKSKVVLKSSNGLKSVNVVTENGVVIGSGATVIHKNIPMVSVLKKNNIKVDSNKNPNFSAIPVVNECSSPVVRSDFECTRSELDIPEGTRKKKKLNLEEYRVRREERERIRSQESSRASSPVPCCTPSVQPDSTTSGSQDGVAKEKPLMLSVEVQTQTCDFIDLTSSKSAKEQEKSRMDRKEKRNDLKHRSYRSRHVSSSSSSSSAESDRHRSHRRKRSSRRRSRHRKSSASRMWSRSPSRSSSRSHSVASSRSRSRSRDRRQKWRSRSPRRVSRYDNSKVYHRDRSWQRGHSPMRGARTQEFPSQEKVRQVEERRVIYVGRIEEGTTKADLRKRFQQFGPIVDISVHFRERGDNYGFVTFAYKADAYKAVEHGNDDPKLPRYDLCFGGRRAFCKQRYADLDGLATNVHGQYGGPPMMMPQRSNESFDLLLNEVKAQLRKRSSV